GARAGLDGPGLPPPDPVASPGAHVTPDLQLIAEDSRNGFTSAARATGSGDGGGGGAPRRSGTPEACAPPAWREGDAAGALPAPRRAPPRSATRSTRPRDARRSRGQQSPPLARRGRDPCSAGRVPRRRPWRERAARA